MEGKIIAVIYLFIKVYLICLVVRKGVSLGLLRKNSRKFMVSSWNTAKTDKTTFLKMLFVRKSLNLKMK